MAWDTLKEAISSFIKTNNNQEITGQVLQNTLNSIINSVGEYATFAGIAEPTTNPGSPDGPIFYLATTQGTYNNFGGITVGFDEAVILLFEGTKWSKKETGFATATQIRTETTYNASSLASSAYYDLALSVGSIAPTDSKYNASFRCACIPVIKGALITLATNGSYNGRAYALTDKSRRILELSGVSSTTAETFTLSVIEDGYLYVNHNSSLTGTFKLSIKIPINKQVEELVETVQDMSETVNRLDESVDASLIQKMYGESDLLKSYYYDLALAVGSIAPSSPKFNSAGTFECMCVPIVKGSIINVTTKGGWNGRAYALTDKDRKILVLSGATVTTDTTATLTVTEDGFLYVNFNNDEVNQPFNVTIKIPSGSLVNSLDSRVTEMEVKLSEATTPMMYNPVLNLQKEQLRVLDIGNSYTVDSTHYLPNLISAAGIDVTNMCHYVANMASASFKTWIDAYNNKNSKAYYISKTFGGLTANTSGTSAVNNGEQFRTLLKNNTWDLIIIHQASTYAPYFDQWEDNTEAGHLSEFIRLIRKHQPKATLGFLLVHSYWSDYQYNTEKSSFKRWELIANSAKKLRAHYGIDFIIPYGTAIQNLRASSLNNAYDLTSDGVHCANGIADYTAACAYFQSLLAPRYGVSILGNTARITVAQDEQYPSSDVSVTDANAPTCQKAAFLATYNWYKCINPDTITDEGLM